MRLKAAAVMAATLVCGLGASPAAASWTTYHHDGSRSGYDPDSSSPLPPSSLWQTSPALDGDIWGEPLVYGSRVYVATENDTIYALNAATGAVIWHQHVGTPVPESTATCGDIGDVGITGTPVIDPTTGRIYAVAATWDGANTSSIQHRLVALGLTDGKVAFSIPADAAGSNPRYQLQRPGLALSAGRIAIGYGGHDGDCGDYHGWVVSAPESGTGGLDAFEVDPGGSAGAVWGAGNAPAVDAHGNFWVATGNGFGSGFGFQESVVKLSPTMSVLGSFTPSNWQSLDAHDVDLGSSEPLPLPGGMYFQIGKEGVGYLLDSTPKQLFSAQVCPGLTFGGGTYYAGVIYVTCADGLRALTLNPSAHTFTSLGTWNPSDSPMGPPIIAGGAVWSTDWGSGTLYALDRATGATRFSRGLGTIEHFATPSAAQGRLFIAAGPVVSAFTIARAPVVKPPPPKAARIILLKLSVSGRRLTLRVGLTLAAKLKVTFRRRNTGRRVRGHCRAHAAKGARCVFYVRKRTTRLAGKTGGNTFRLKLTKLPAGRYQAIVFAQSATGLSTKHYALRFRLTRR